MLRCVAPILLLVLVVSVTPAFAGDADEWKSTLVAEGDPSARVKAGIQLALEDPDLFAKAVEEVAGEKREGDAAVLADIAVKIKVRHIRILLIWAVSKFKEAGTQAFLDKIDNDRPGESIYALEALGFLKDHSAYGRIIELLRNENELIAIQAARAAARVGKGADAKGLAQAAVEIDNPHVRLHLVWATQDVAGGKGSATKLFLRNAGNRGTMGFRAKEAIAVLEDELAPVEKYKVKLDVVRKFFNPRGGVKAPPIKGDEDYAKIVMSGLADMKKKSPAWYHMVCVSINKIEISGALWRFEFKSGALNLRPADLIKWGHDDTLEWSLMEYYLIRYATILFLANLGCPTEGHRGWEEGFMEAWHYAMEHTKINISEDPVEFLKARIEARPW